MLVSGGNQRLDIYIKNWQLDTTWYFQWCSVEQRTKLLENEMRLVIWILLKMVVNAHAVSYVVSAMTIQ